MGIPSAAPSEHDVELDRLRDRILVAIDPVLRATGVDAHEVTCELHGGLERLEVVLRGPSEALAVRQALGVRVLDAVRQGERTIGAVRVTCRLGAER
jgi:hypothetical protein